MDQSIKISVVICSYNRASGLSRVIDSVASQKLPESIGWEVVVVDNNSTDQTRQAVEACQQRYPGLIRYLFEPRQGLSFARNTGIQHARGDILAFIDDDEFAAEGWLEALTANLHDPQWAGAGGRVVPEWTEPRPNWLRVTNPFTLGPLAGFDPGFAAGQMTDPPVGANMAFRKDMFGKYGGFRTDLGRTGENLISNEDIEFGRRLIAAGERLRFEPEAVTYHPVSESRIRRSYFLAWWFNKGRSDVRERGCETKGLKVLGRLILLCRYAAVEAVRWSLSMDRSLRFVCRLKIWNLAGQGIELWCEMLEARQKGRALNPALRSEHN